MFFFMYFSSNFLGTKYSLQFYKITKTYYGHELNKDGLFLKLRTLKIRLNKMITKVYQNYDIDKSLQLYLGVKSYKIVLSSYKLP